jgi:hypothetical protein
MATSEVEICNLALRHLGISNEIGDLETSAAPEAQACRAFYDTVRDAVLRDFPWPFANRTVELAGQEETPAGDYAYSYVYPSDCVQALRILSGVRSETQSTKVKYRIANGVSSTLIHTDDSAPILEYTIREEDPTRYPADFVIALSYRLASYLAPSVTGGDPFDLGARALQRYAMEISQAQARAGNEETSEEQPDASWIAER